MEADTYDCACNDPNYDNGSASGNSEDKIEYKPININELTSITNFSHSNRVSLFLEISESGILEISIYDLMGVQILQQSSYTIKGNHRQELVLPKNTASGIYFILANIGKERVVRKFIKP